ncbi:hypothetical protein [Mycobacterium sp. 155]|uniref:hypothetical protein n=1 Tax=Mycobacterium sp. 155 TaxID=1157943 RepID=UPI0003A277F7|nr:hypothetical protein [Mycobacterium sp. 155]
MNDQPYDLFGDVFRRYFRRSVDVYPNTGRTLVHRLLTSTDEVQDRLSEAQHAAVVWSRAESGHADIHSELFMITQCGLMYAASFEAVGHRMYYLATPSALFDVFVDQVDGAAPQSAAVVAVDRRCGHDLAAAHPMDAALRRILDEHEALRVDVLAA